LKKIIFSFIFIVILTGCGKKTADVTVFPPKAEHITVSFSGKPEFQPHSAENRSMGFCLGLVYEPLFQIEEDGICVPVLAEKIVSRGNEADIYLKEGVKWHDGSDFVPEDVVYTISLMAGGMSVYPKGIIDGVKVKSKNCVTVYLKSPVWDAERLFTFPIIKNNSPLSMKVPNGTGAYKYRGKLGFDTYLFEGAENNDILPLRMIRVRDKEREDELFKCGITDVIFVEESDLARYIPLADSIEIKYPTNHITYIGFNCTSVPVEFRKALFYALNTADIAEDIWGSKARPSVVPYLSGESFSYRRIPNITLARSALTSCGYISDEGKAVTLRIGVMNGDGHRELAEKVSAVYGGLGVFCAIEEWSVNGAYDITVGTDNSGGGMWSMLSAENAFNYNTDLLLSASSVTEFNNIFFENLPFIPVAFRCHAVFYREEAEKFPLFFR